MMWDVHWPSFWLGLLALPWAITAFFVVTAVVMDLVAWAARGGRRQL